MISAVNSFSHRSIRLYASKFLKLIITGHGEYAWFKLKAIFGFHGKKINKFFLQK